MLTWNCKIDGLETFGSFRTAVLSDSGQKQSARHRQSTSHLVKRLEISRKFDNTIGDAPAWRDVECYSNLTVKVVTYCLDGIVFGSDPRRWRNRCGPAIIKRCRRFLFRDLPTDNQWDHRFLGKALRIYLTGENPPLHDQRAAWAQQGNRRSFCGDCAIQTVIDPEMKDDRYITLLFGSKRNDWVIAKLGLHNQWGRRFTFRRTVE